MTLFWVNRADGSQLQTREQMLLGLSAIADQSPKGRDGNRLDAKHASGGARSAIAKATGVA